jgi:hypothetical protein
MTEKEAKTHPCHLRKTNLGKSLVLVSEFFAEILESRSEDSDPCQNLTDPEH